MRASRAPIGTLAAAIAQFLQRLTPVFGNSGGAGFLNF